MDKNQVPSRPKAVESDMAKRWSRTKNSTAHSRILSTFPALAPSANTRNIKTEGGPVEEECLVSGSGQRICKIHVFSILEAVLPPLIPKLCAGIQRGQSPTPSDSFICSGNRQTSGFVAKTLHLPRAQIAWFWSWKMQFLLHTRTESAAERHMKIL